MEESKIDRPALRSLPGAGSRSITIALYILVVFLYWMSMYLYLPTLPTYIKSKVPDLAMVGSVLAMFGLVQAIVRLPIGIGADWLNWHKPFIIGGLVMTGMGAWMLGRASSPEALHIGRALTGLGAGVWAVLMVAFSNLFPSDKAVQASAILTLVSTIGRLAPTGVTGVLNQAGGYELAFLLAAATSAAAIVLMLVVGEPPRPRQTPSLRGLSRLMTRRPVWLPSALNALCQYVVWAGPFGFVPILARQLGATETTLSLLLSLNLGAQAVGNLLTAWVAGRIRSQHLVIVNFVLLGAGVGMIALAAGMPGIFIGLILMGLSQGVGYPALIGLSIEQVDENERTTALGLHHAIYAVGMFGGPWLSGLLADAIGLQPMFGLTAGASLVIGLFGANWLERDRPPPRAE